MNYRMIPENIDRGLPAKSKLLEGRHNRSSGFTLVEITVAMLIFALLVAGIFRFFLFINDSWVDGYSEQQIMSNMQRVQSYMGQDIKEAVINPVPPYNYCAAVNDNGNEIVIFKNQPPPNNTLLEQVYYYLDQQKKELERTVILPDADGSFPQADPAVNPGYQWTILLQNVVGGDPYYGIVNTSGTTVTFVSGQAFNTGWTAGTGITINNVQYTIASVSNPSQLTLTSPGAPTQTGVAYAHTPIFAMNDADSDHPNLSVDVTLECSNPVRPSVPLAIEAAYAVRSNMNI